MKNILVIGCGLLGSSLVRKIHKKKIAKNIYVYEKSKKYLSQIKQLKLPCKILNKLDSNVSNCDLIIFCTPMSEYKNIIKKINTLLSYKNLVTDIGSSKTETQKIVNKYFNKNINWVSGHPIAGSEVSGPKNGSSEMFYKKWCVLIKEKNTNTESLKKLKVFWKKIGAKIVMMSAERHDKIFSITSHLPHLIAYNLVKSAQDFEKKEKYDLIQFSAGGLRDFSRIAASNEIMWRDIFFNNHSNISVAIDLFIKNLKNFKKDIKHKRNNSLISKLLQTKKVRSQILRLKHDIDKPDFGRKN
ncbi:MAG: prephenate dehydrogenase/arogenate dehydrogenase family protein [Proteobacteria bacterium]|nr:MAG: prephenate dehydrogenase/arogenate dehydrogenase family protein [Pseudomonadota bacterium]